ncbi:zinc-dependent peptidase [Aquimarina sp. U1-2]|uniref:zinc-dependent peptidase n=1 Tax=Aquimarina sp. U1-2 TaxID=2823141 RepID=UPI001AEC7A70|nr:zinc-dependent peptidase [Aquimarina sp. U1-2]MBP2833672.1 zinc-dependent peptidase [Aquimarina sp. U1-2]
MNHLLAYVQDEPVNSLFQIALGLAVTLGIVSICIYYVLRYLESIYVKYYQKPYYIHFYPNLKILPRNLQVFVQDNDFYNQLDARRKQYFAHRTAKFIENTNFVGREGLVVDDFMRMQIAMMVIQLTFGMRHYLLEYLHTIIVYPSSFYSILNQTENIGEFNPRSKALALSWKDFQKGNLHQDSGKSLGIHEITHAIHYNSIRNNDISSEIFYDTFLQLEQYLGSAEIRKKIVDTKILREYAYTDKFEFIAVLVEVFMESPQELKEKFPKIYTYVMRMLNFRYFE